MICNSWPNCDQTPRCARCVVLDACRAQFFPITSWKKSFDFCEIGGYTATPRDGLTKQIADRLLAWLRWPGTTRLATVMTSKKADLLKQVGLGFDQHTMSVVMSASGIDPHEHVHPLDADERGGELRGRAGCWRCEGRGFYSSPMTGHGIDRCIACDHSCGPDWEYTALVCDVLTERQLWADVHAFRPPL